MSPHDLIAPGPQIIERRRGRPPGKAQKSLDLINAAVDIVRDIHPVSIRAVCYQLFVRKLIDSMSKNNTGMVSRLLVYARKEGLLPWSWIVDETREIESVNTWRSPQEIFEACAQQYRSNYWSEQPDWLQIWSEKSTISGTLRPVLNRYAVSFRVLHGYGSATVIRDTAEMCADAGKRLTILYVGDYDPSGMGMSERDIPDRLAEYCDDLHVPPQNMPDIVRVAILAYDHYLPSFPARDKVTDSRYRWFLENYGEQCWELDAMSPSVLRDRVESEIVDRLDLDAWNVALKCEQAEREAAAAYADGFPAFMRKREKRR
jgi:hypothetical protein